MMMRRRSSRLVSPAPNEDGAERDGLSAPAVDSSLKNDEHKSPTKKTKHKSWRILRKQSRRLLGKGPKKKRGAKTSKPICSGDSGLLALKNNWLADALPAEIRLLVFEYLTPSEADRGIGLTCKLFREEIAHCAKLWERYCVRSGKLVMPPHPSCLLRNPENPFAAHYHRLPSVPDDFPSVGDAMSAVVTKKWSSSCCGTRRRRRKNRIRAKSRLSSRRSTKGADWEAQGREYVIGFGRRPPNSSPRFSFMKGDVIDRSEAEWSWAKSRGRGVEEMLGFHARVMKLGAERDGEGGFDTCTWLYCYGIVRR